MTRTADPLHSEKARPGELLLELLSEEIPARMQRRALDDLTGLLRGKLAAAEIPAKVVRGYVTPRRLAVVADGIPARQPDRTEERRGPRVGAPQAALDGFARAAGLASIEQCEIRETERGAFYFAVAARPGQDTAAVLPDLVQAAIAELPWPKSMRYPASRLRWVRPLNSVVCLFEGEVLPLALDRVPVGRATSGHRWLSQGAIEVAGAADYAARLAEAHVVLDRDERRRRIEAGLAEAAAAAQLTVAPDPELVDEVTGLAEYPVVLSGAIDADFVRPLPEGLPPEVLGASMRTHQRYFSCLNPDGSPAARFLFVADNLAPDDGRTIVAGNERVLRARLADARFFWDQDRKTRLEDRVEALKGRVYHEKLGSMYAKAERMEQLATFLANHSFVTPAEAGVQGDRSEPTLDSRFRGNDGEGGVPPSELTRRAGRAARLAKADLSTGMVGEFPELQGVMGRYYALHDQDEPPVADAIADHYKPLGPSDTVPTAPESIVVALADKIDALIAFFSVGERPTGSGDPYALRRAAQGIIRIILENKLRLPLMGSFLKAAEPLRLPLEKAQAAATGLLSFIAERLKVHLRDAGVRHDLIAAAFEQVGVMGTARAGKYEDDLVRLLAKVEALKAFLATDDGANLLTAYRRASNIVTIEERRDKSQYGQVFDAGLLQQREEKVLAENLEVVTKRVGDFLQCEKFNDAMASLATLRRPVDEFFDRVTVNTDEKNVRANRLRLLTRIRNTMDQVADFSKIEG